MPRPDSESARKIGLEICPSKPPAKKSEFSHSVCGDPYSSRSACILIQCMYLFTFFKYLAGTKFSIVLSSNKLNLNSVCALEYAYLRLLNINLIDNYTITTIIFRSSIKTLSILNLIKEKNYQFVNNEGIKCLKMKYLYCNNTNKSYYYAK